MHTFRSHRYECTTYIPSGTYIHVPYIHTYIHVCTCRPSCMIPSCAHECLLYECIHECTHIHAY